MKIETLISFFAYSSIINYIFLIIWFLLFSTAHNWLYRIHSMWFDISYDKFDSIHYFSMAIYKILIIIFSVVPYIVLKFFI